MSAHPVPEAATRGQSGARLSTITSALTKLTLFLLSGAMPNYPSTYKEFKEADMESVLLFQRFVGYMEVTYTFGAAQESLAVSTILEYNRCVMHAFKTMIEEGYRMANLACSIECQRFFSVLDPKAGSTWLRVMEDALRRRYVQARDAAGQSPVLVDSAIPVPVHLLPYVFHALFYEGSPDALLRVAYGSNLYFSVSRPSEPAGVRWTHMEYNPAYGVFHNLVLMDKTSTVKWGVLLPASPDSPHAACLDQFFAQAALACTGYYNGVCEGAPSPPMFPDLWSKSNSTNATFAGKIL